MKKISELIDLKGRCAVITGATGHLGRTFCYTLSELGCDLAIVDIDPKQCKELSDEISDKYGTDSLALNCDISVESDVAVIPEKVKKHFGRMDILINNAAYVGTSGLEGWATSFDKQLTSTWRQAVEVNLTAIFTLCRESISLLKNSGNGSIINIASIYGLLGPDWSLYEGTEMGNPAAYAASKGGLIQFTRWLSTTCAPEVRVNSICPGGIFRNQNEVFLERYIARTPLRRMAGEEDFKGIITYLSSDMSRYATGQNFIIDGGFSAW